MKRLFLLRHAQAAATHIGGIDKERPLTAKGKSDAQTLGRTMIARGYVPDLILCSSARRTKETLAAVAQSFESKIKTIERDGIYNGGRSELLNFIQECDNIHQHILMVGHNPSIYETAVTLAGNGTESLMNTLMQGFRPGTLAALECSCESWAELQPGAHTLIDLLSPEN